MKNDFYVRALHYGTEYAREMIDQPDDHLDAVDAIASDFAEGIMYVKDTPEVLLDALQEYIDEVICDGKQNEQEFLDFLDKVNKQSVRV